MKASLKQLFPQSKRKKRVSSLKTIVKEILLLPLSIGRWGFRNWRWLLLRLCILGILSGITLISLYHFLIVKYPGEKFKRENILKQISLETPVYYRDGKSKIGVFFDEAHRNYLRSPKPGEKVEPVGPEGSGTIPRLFLDCLVASEDKHFYKHKGIDPIAILRAAIANFKAGKVVQGGSTLTQQTAENIFHHGRSLKDKFFEAIDTLKLEAHFSKDEILEFYTNQFFVNSNGRGLGVAARYYFDKTPDELNLVESAFIVGSVKAPSRYNPFTKTDAKSKKTAEDHSFDRKNYVINNMYKLTMITETERDAALKEKVPFRKGNFQFDRNVILDHIESILQSQDFERLFVRHGIFNLATSGLKIYTTLDKAIQETALYGVRKHLSRTQTILKGYTPPESSSKIEVLNRLFPNEFYLGKIKEIRNEGEKREIWVDFGHVEGMVALAEIEEMVKRIKHHEDGEYAKVKPEDIDAFLKTLNPGDLIFTSAISVDPETNVAQLTIEENPEIQGGLIVLDQGKIRAMVGGFDNIHFNRAIQAKRQVGSTFKPIVYLAALQLGWSPLDPLINHRQFFPFQGDFYYPKADHKAKSEEVSMAWAGTKSENLATIYLLFHLLDKLNFSQFQEIAKRVDMAPRPEENAKAFAQRLRDMGIGANPDRYKQGLFEEVKQEIVPELIFNGEDRQISALKTLQYGAGYVEEEERIKTMLGIPILDENGKPKKKPESSPELTSEDREELAGKLHILKLNYVRLKKMNDEWVSRKAQLRELARTLKWEEMLPGDLKARVPRGFYILSGSEETNDLKVSFTTDERSDLPEVLPKTLLTYMSQAEKGLLASNPLASDQIYIDGMLTSSVIDNIARLLDDKLIKLQSRYSSFDLRALFFHRDFRTLVGLRYLVAMTHQIGVSSPLEAILSFPLGSNAVSLLDIALAYQTFQDGTIYNFSEGEMKNEASIISHIEDASGKVIFEAKRREFRVIDPMPAYLASTILNSVVRFGTGYRASTEVYLTGAEIEAYHDKKNLGDKQKFRVPLYGKTGTSDNYTNATFVGFVPYPVSPDEDMSLKNSYTIASYVGFDDNQKMLMKDKKHRIRIDGARGALPPWIHVANTIIRQPEYVKNIDVVDLSFQVENMLPVKHPKDIFTVRVGSDSGIYPLRSGEKETAIVEACGIHTGATPQITRFFTPFMSPAPPEKKSQDQTTSQVSMREEESF